MKKTWFLLSFLVLIGGICSYLLLSSWNNRSLKTSGLSETQKQEALKNLLGRKPKLQEKILSAGETRYQGKYFSLTYPVKAVVYDRKNTALEANKSLLEFFRFDDKEPSLTFVAQVLTFSGANLGEFSAVSMRRNQNELYREEAMNIAGEQGVVFRKTNGGFEKSAFFLKGDKVFSFVATSPDPAAEEVFDRVIGSVEF